MEEISKSPNFNLKVVLNETGIKPDTLRAWERRYGLPMPERSGGGHRLYSQYDIETIKWLMMRLEEGLRINRAVKLWRSIEASGQDPLVEMPVEEDKGSAVPLEPVSGTALEDMRLGWIEACKAFDEKRAELILAQAFASYPVETVCVEILRKGLSQIGSQWYEGDVTVQQEHFASGQAIRKLNVLLAAAPPPTRGGTILVACPPIEDHVFPPLMISLFLRRRGWNVIYLGANVPLDHLDDAIKVASPDLVILTAMQLYTAANLKQVAQFLTDKGVPLGYGGLIFTLLPSLVESMPGYYLGDSLDQVVQVVERVLSSPPHLKSVPAPSKEYNQAFDIFVTKLPLIDAYMWDVGNRNGMELRHLEFANEYLARDIKAALKLGDIGLAGEELSWIEALLENRDVPPEFLYGYMQFYQQALEKHLDERGKPILEWVEMINKSHD
jgi:methanogenic corrinoid protein MtbC1